MVVLHGCDKRESSSSCCDDPARIYVSEGGVKVDPSIVGMTAGGAVYPTSPVIVVASPLLI